MTSCREEEWEMLHAMYMNEIISSCQKKEESHIDASHDDDTSCNWTLTLSLSPRDDNDKVSSFMNIQMILILIFSPSYPNTSLEYLLSSSTNISNQDLSIWKNQINRLIEEATHTGEGNSITIVEDTLDLLTEWKTIIKTTCCICLNDVVHDTLTLSCGHVFHEHCLTTWLTFIQMNMTLQKEEEEMKMVMKEMDTLLKKKHEYENCINHEIKDKRNIEMKWILECKVRYSIIFYLLNIR